MAKFLVLQILVVGLIWLVKSNPEEVSAPVVWRGSPRSRWWNRRRTNGYCEFNTTRSYEKGEFTVNVTFDSTVREFKLNNFLKWRKTSQSIGNWYNLESRFSFEAGQTLDVEFSARGTSQTLPGGVCQGLGNIEECEADIDFGGISVNTGGGVLSGKGTCIFSIFENVTAGGLTVNVTFDDAVLTFANRDVLTLDSVNPGMWYFSQSLVDYFVGDTLVYEFDVTWDTVDFPEGTCLANIACNDVIPTTMTTTPGPTLPPID